MTIKYNVELTNEGRLPSDLLRTYVQYKQDTKAIIEWLVAHGASGYKDAHSISIRDLYGLAEIVRKKAVQMPDSIAFHFREAIAARTQLSNYFRKQTLDGMEVGAETQNHEFFTTSLAKIFADLCACCTKPKEDREPIQGSDSPKNVPNRFSALGVDATELYCPSDEEDRHEPVLAKQKSKTPSEDSCPYVLADDVLSDCFQFIKDIQEMCDLADAVVSIWEKAGTGESSTLVAALVTNTVLANVEDIESRLKVSTLASDPTTLLAIFGKLAAIIGCPIGEDSSPGSFAQELLESLQLRWQQLLDVRDRGPSFLLPPSLGESTNRQTTDLILRRGMDTSEADDICFMTLLLNLVDHSNASYLSNSVLRFGTPLYAEVAYYVFNKKPDHNDCGLYTSYAIRVFLQSYKSYCFTMGPARAVDNRVQALQFAQEGLKSIEAVLNHATMPCRCEGTLAYHLEKTRHEFGEYITVNKFDFLFQSPWVCGSHMLEMANALFCHGLRLLTYRNYVGSIVHAYNMLRKVNKFDSIPLLESLCDAFGDSLFPGGRPDRNFVICYHMFMGGRIRFDVHAPGRKSHKSGCHFITIPTQTARATAGFGDCEKASELRLSCRKLSSFYHIREKKFHLDAATWDQVHKKCDNRKEDTPKGKKSRPCSHHGHPKENPFSSCRPQERFESLHQAMLTEFTGSFPIAKINLMKVYLACLQVVSKITDGHHGEKESGKHCTCFIDQLLADGDRCRGYGNKCQPSGSKHLIRTCQRAMVEILGGEKVEEFVWEGI